MITETLKASVTTDCLCENEDGTPQEYCYGDCYEWQKEDVFELLGLWQVANDVDEDDPILIECDKLGWRMASAYKWTTMLELHGALSLNGDFRIEWYLDEGVLTARRYSHDEPMGTGLFTFTIHKGCDKCGEPVKADVYKEELGMCLDCHTAYFDHEGE